VDRAQELGTEHLAFAPSVELGIELFQQGTRVGFVSLSGESVQTFPFCWGELQLFHRSLTFSGKREKGNAATSAPARCQQRRAK
jgi:hypothetical protein